jgi:hypothetical protein
MADTTGWPSIVPTAISSYNIVRGDPAKRIATDKKPIPQPEKAGRNIFFYA